MNIHAVTNYNRRTKYIAHALMRDYIGLFIYIHRWRRVEHISSFSEEVVDKLKSVE